MEIMPQNIRSQDQTLHKTMDEAIDLLLSWDLAELCDKFREQEVCTKAFQHLTETDLCQLIPKMGPRSIFRTRLGEWRQKQEINKNIASPSTNVATISFRNDSGTIETIPIQMETADIEKQWQSEVGNMESGSDLATTTTNAQNNVNNFEEPLLAQYQQRFDDEEPLQIELDNSEDSSDAEDTANNNNNNFQEQLLVQYEEQFGEEEQPHNVFDNTEDSPEIANAPTPIAFTASNYDTETTSLEMESFDDEDMWENEADNMEVNPEAATTTTLVITTLNKEKTFLETIAIRHRATEEQWHDDVDTMQSSLEADTTASITSSNNDSTYLEMAPHQMQTPNAEEQWHNELDIMQNCIKADTTKTVAVTTLNIAKRFVETIALKIESADVEDQWLKEMERIEDPKEDDRFSDTSSNPISSNDKNDMHVLNERDFSHIRFSYEEQLSTLHQHEVVNVHEILKNCAAGLAAFEYYDTFKSLDIYHRYELVIAVIDYVNKKGIRPTVECFLELARQFTEIYPNEKFETYYVPGTSSTSSKGLLHKVYKLYFKAFLMLHYINWTLTSPKLGQ